MNNPCTKYPLLHDANDNRRCSISLCYALMAMSDLMCFTDHVLYIISCLIYRFLFIVFYLPRFTDLFY